jgi:gephyrin
MHTCENNNMTGSTLGQDGYAVIAADGPGDYDIAFEALAGTAPGHLEAGKVAYITTGTPATS